MGCYRLSGCMYGAITYDIVSLAYDLYTQTTYGQRKQITDSLYQRLYNKNPCSYKTWQQWIEVTILQRHIKNIGTFARLKTKYNKSTYFQFIDKIKQDIAYFANHNRLHAKAMHIIWSHYDD